MATTKSDVAGDLADPIPLDPPPRALPAFLLLCFDRPHFYNRDWMAILCGLSIVSALHSRSRWRPVCPHCSIGRSRRHAFYLPPRRCHGELVRARPESRPHPLLPRRRHRRSNRRRGRRRRVAADLQSLPRVPARPHRDVHPRCHSRAPGTRTVPVGQPIPRARPRSRHLLAADQPDAVAGFLAQLLWHSSSHAVIHLPRAYARTNHTWTAIPQRGLA
jgi:hypothetical protein